MLSSQPLPFISSIGRPIALYIFLSTPPSALTFYCTPLLIALWPLEFYFLCSPSLSSLFLLANVLF